MAVRDGTVVSNPQWKFVTRTLHSFPKMFTFKNKHIFVVIGRTAFISKRRVALTDAAGQNQQKKKRGLSTENSAPGVLATTKTCFYGTILLLFPIRGIPSAEGNKQWQVFSPSLIVYWGVHISVDHSISVFFFSGVNYPPFLDLWAPQSLSISYSASHTASVVHRQLTITTFLSFHYKVRPWHNRQ